MTPTQLSPNPDAPLLRVTGLSKSFGGVQALRGVRLEVGAGEVHALCGENGAGKSTLIKALCGVHRPDAGEILFNGQPLPPGDVRASEAAGIAVIHQESTAFPDLDAVDNVFVGRELRAGRFRLDRVAMERQTAGLLARLGEDFDPRVPLARRTVAQCQMVAMARALSRRCRLLILDEPSAALSRRETEALFGIVRKLRSEGVSILYVSHRMEEIHQLADRITVFRDGEWICSGRVDELPRARLIQHMVGREIDETARPAARDFSAASVVLEVQALHGERFRDISLSVRSGEIVGLAGLVGAGRSGVARAIFGVDRPFSGTVRLSGKLLPPGEVPAAVRAGLALVPEDRQHEGLVLPMTIGENITLPILRTLTRGPFLSAVREDEVSRPLIAGLAVKTTGTSLPVHALSGGNQQKVLLAKWLATKPRMLILDEPTKGVDVGAKAELYQLVRRLAGQGLGLLVISSDLQELLQLSDRILVMCEGRLRGELTGARATPEEVLALALPDASATGGRRHA